MAITEAKLQKAGKLASEALGAWFEHELQEVFNTFKQQERFTFHRFYDSKSAGNFLPPQPADFLVAAKKGAYLVEAKASAKHPSLRSCLASNVSKEQAVHHFMWHRAYQNSVFIFLSVKTETLQIWDGKYVADHRRAGTVLSEQEGIITTASALDLEPILHRFFLGA